MTWWQMLLGILGVIGIPGLILFYIKRRFDKHDAQYADRQEFQFLMLKASIASISLGEEAACCIKEGKPTEALADAKVYACGAKNEIRDFAQKQGVKNLI